MTDRFLKFYGPVNRFQFPLPMQKWTRLTTGRARLRFGKTFRPSQRQPLRRRLRDCPSQRMPCRLQDVKRHLPLQEVSHIDFQPIGQPQEKSPTPVD